MSVAQRLVSWFGAGTADPDALPVRTSMGRVSNATPVRLLGFDQALVGVTPVSYTHLTLPTIYSV